MRTIIAPSLLSANFLNLESEIRTLNVIDNLWLHLDIMDNHFVPNLTFGQTVLKDVHKVSNHPLDAHFMVTDPLSFIEPFKEVKLKNFTFHIETVADPVATCKELKKHFESVGVSIKPKTETSDLTMDVLKEVDLVLVMSVEPGFGGQKFMPSALEKISELKDIRNANGFNFKIEVDGGVNDMNSKKLIKAGADILVAGSYIFNNAQEEYSKRIHELRGKH